MDIGRPAYRNLEFAAIRGARSYTIFALALVSLATACALRPVTPHSSDDDLPRSFGPIVNPKPPNPVALTAASVDDFLIWVQGVPQSQTALIREQIAQAANDNAVIEALATRLIDIPVQDIGRHLMILSILGETRNPRAVDPLNRFVWFKDPLVREPNKVLGPGIHTSRFNYDGGLRARAAEMLAYIGTDSALQATRDVVRQHPGQEVRIAAIDAYLFHYQDSEEAKAELQRIAEADERKLIGIPRRTRDMDVKDFDARLHAFYERYPEERAPVPVQQLPDRNFNSKGTPKRRVPESQSK